MISVNDEEIGDHDTVYGHCDGGRSEHVCIEVCINFIQDVLALVPYWTNKGAEDCG